MPKLKYPNLLTTIGADAPNGLWCADYKGEFMLGTREHCYPLTISDYRSRYLLAGEGPASTRSEFAIETSPSLLWSS